MGFELGIDDYVTKPFSPKELMARIKAVTERFKGDTNVKLQFEGLVVDTEGVNVYVDQEKFISHQRNMNYWFI